jgi:hydrogenase-4 component F
MNASGLMLILLLAGPAVLALLLLGFRSRLLNRIVLVLTGAGHLALAGCSFAGILGPATLAPWFRMDSLNGFFLLITSIVFLCAAVYNAAYMPHSSTSALRQSVHSALILVFLSCLSGVLLTTHLGLLWVFLEATTLASAPLIFLERSRSSLEATWKYIFICSIGISFAFAGLVLLSFSARGPGSLFLDDLMAGAAGLDLFWLKLAFAFLAVGLGTKAGLAPVHGWLPDAHSEAPSPVSALLSGALLNAAFYALMRTTDLMNAAGGQDLTRVILLLMGFLSLFVCAVFTLRSRHFKRMLAYSSVENIGIACIALSFGPAALGIVLLHLLSHSLAKAGLFLTSGNIHLQMKTREIGSVTGLVRSDPLTGALWIAGFLAVSAVPPFPAFFSELAVMKGLLAGSPILFAIFCLLLGMILFGMGRNILQMSFGTPPPGSEPGCRSPLSYAPQILLLCLLVLVSFLVVNRSFGPLSSLFGPFLSGRG